MFILPVAVQQQEVMRMTAQSSALRLRKPPKLIQHLVKFRTKYRWTAIICFVLYLIGGGLTAAVRIGTMTSMHHTTYTASDYLTVAGVSPGVNFPLSVGLNNTGKLDPQPHFYLLTGGEAVAAGLEPSDKLRMLLRIGNKSFPLDIQFGGGSTIVRSNVKFGTLRYEINNESINTVRQRTRYMAANFFSYDSRNLKSDQPTIYDTAAWQKITDRGIGTFLQKHLLHINIILPAAQYDSLFGAQNS